uniref:F-box domain-containing protein n=1 Tax=Steinernema glaseri TaxID=37863 RepID=A0A1I7XZ85_9BILA
MDHLSYDLVEELASFLPRPDLETIARVAARSSALEKWSVMSEDQLERRFLLDIYVQLQGFERKEEEAEKSPQIRISVQKHLPGETTEEWDFICWRYAWIRKLYIFVSLEEELRDDRLPRLAFKESDLHQVMRLVSLPVDRSVRSTLHVDYDEDGDNFSTCPNLVDLFWKIVGKTRKEFVAVEIVSIFAYHDPLDLFAAQSIEQEAFLQDLSYSRHGDYGATQRRIFEAIAPFFGKTRGKPLQVCFGSYVSWDDVELIIDAWLLSDGTVEEKVIDWYEEEDAPGICDALKGKYRDILQIPDGGFLAHPTRRSSLSISEYEIRVVKFDPCHVPVDFEWIDAVINKWREGCGLYVYNGHDSLYVNFKGPDDWLKLAEKYGPAVDDGANLLQLVHPKNPSFKLMANRRLRTGTWTLELTMEFEPWHVPVDFERIDAVIEQWKTGCGYDLYGGQDHLSFKLKGSDDLRKLAQKYNITMHEAGPQQLAQHRENPSFLVLTRSDSRLELRVKFIRFGDYWSDFISDWEKGNGETLDGLTKMKFRIDGYPPLPSSLSHPLGNTRCLIASEAILNYVVVSLHIVPEEMEDNSELLSGSLDA